MTLPIDRIAAEVFGRPLLLLPEKLAEVAALIGARAGFDVDRPEPGASRFVGSTVERSGRGLAYARTADGVAIISIVGSLVNRGAWIGANSGLVSYEGIRAQIASALADPEVSTILLDLETPGGQAVGAFETADAIRLAARQKPVTAVVNGMAASAGYALASGANRIVTTSSGLSGSIGVVLLHADHSRRLDREGITPTLIHAGARKVDGNPLEPLSDDARSRLQGEVDALHRQFVATVAKGRPSLSPKAIRDTEAAVFTGQDAVSAGLADAVGTFEDALAELSRRRPPRPAPSTRTAAAARLTSEAADYVAGLGRGIAEAAGLTGPAADAMTRIAEGALVGAYQGGEAAARQHAQEILALPEAAGFERAAASAAVAAGMSVEGARGFFRIQHEVARENRRAGGLRAKEARVGLVLSNDKGELH